MRQPWLRFVILATALLSPAGDALAQARPAQPFNPAGRWRFFHTDGSPFVARLGGDQTAAITFGYGETGIWRWEGPAVRVIYTDGWDDLLSRNSDGSFTKSGWAPGADRCAPPSNHTRAELVDGNPGPPLR